jgi:glycosyltransferase involved in cell wall biosynthesis
MTVKSPSVTISMPVYNTAEYIAQAIDSALAQSYTDLELLIVDNASTDTTCDIAMAAIAQLTATIR